MSPKDRQLEALRLVDELWSLDRESAMSEARERCGDDPDLLAEVVSLLDSDQTSHLAEPVRRRLQALEQVRRQQAGDRIGDYRLIEMLGSGGVGDVFKAEHVSPAMRRHVAIKILRQRIELREARSRMLAEREILSGLQHPNIARLYEIGTTEDGRPYFVLEWVNGLPLDQFCAERSPGLEDRLRLFCDLCDAVHYAHQQFIVHRDLKPANVLVDRDGSLKLLDFSIAKSLRPSPLSIGSITSTGRQPMTVAYASPEQILDREITTATDVHGLGLILYQLLADRHPFEFESLAVHELADAICRQRRPRPSRRAASCHSGVFPRNRSDAARLDAIVLRALEIAPRARYRSADQLGQDVSNYLNLRPILASPAGPLRDLVLGLRRHRAISFIVFLSLALNAMTVAFLFEQRSTAERESRVAEDERRKAEESAAFLAAFLDADGPVLPFLTAVGEEDSGSLLDQTLRWTQSSPSLPPGVEVALLAKIATAYLDVGDARRSVEVLQQASQAWRELEVRPPSHLAGTLNELAAAYLRAGDLDQSAAYYRQALDTAISTRAPDIECVAASLDGLARIAEARDDPQAALSHSLRAVHLRSTLLPPGDDRLIESLEAASAALSRNGRHEESLELAARALSGRMQAAGPADPRTARSRWVKAKALHAAGLFRAAIDEYAAAAEIWTEQGQEELAREAHQQLSFARAGRAPARADQGPRPNRPSS